MAAIAFAAAATALRPSSGTTPAWADLPIKVASTVFWEGERTMTPPTGPVQSRQKPHSATSRSRALALAPRRPPSSPTVSNSSMPACGSLLMNDVFNGVDDDRDRRLVVGAQHGAAAAA